MVSGCLLFLRTLINIKKIMRILIADDNVEILDQLRNFLEMQGHGVIEAQDGNQALELFEQQKVDAVFSALTMPKMGGMELLKELKALRANLPFVLISRHEGAQNILAALHLGACDFLIKPLTTANLHRTLHQVSALYGDYQFDYFCLERSISESRSLELGNDFEYINQIVAFITRDVPFYGILEKEDLFSLDIVLAEALENAIFHGNLEIPSELKNDRYSLFQEEGTRRRQIKPYRDRKIYLFYEITQNSVKYVIRDEGNGFAHENILDPRDPDNLFRITGRGMLLTINFMDEVFWNERGNEITMVRYRKRNQ